MEISSNKITNNIPFNKALIPNSEKSPSIAAQTSTQLPALNTIGISQVNSNLPVSYTKIADIPIPGINKTASVFKLSNGQKIAILPKEGPTFIRTSFNVGALNEPDNIRGISHFIEHNLFNGSKDLAPGEYDKKLSQMGGYTNAFTSYGETQYYLSTELLENNSLEEAIKLNAMQTQFPTFPQEQLTKEKEPVKSEIDMYKDIPSAEAESFMLKNLFGIQSSAEDIVIGTKDNINALTRDTVVDYYNTWYTPDNAVTVITGDVDVNEAINLAAKYYNKKPDYSKVQNRQYTDLQPANKPQRVDFTHKSAKQASMCIGFPIDANTSQRELDKLNFLFKLISAKNSNLSKLLDEYGTSLDLSVNKLSSDNNAPKAVIAQIETADEKVEPILKAIYQGITDLVNNPPTEQELRNQIANHIDSFRNTGQYAEYISSDLISIVNNNDYNYFNDTCNTIAALTPQDISNLARKYLDLNKISMAIAHPQTLENEEKTNAPSTVSFGKSVDIEQKLKTQTGKIQQYTLPNNLFVSAIPVDNNADAIVSLSLETNEDFNVSQPLIDVMEEMLNRGSMFRNKAQMSDIMENLAADYAFSVTSKGIELNTRLHPDRITATLPFIKEALTAPNFTQQEFERAKEIVKNDINAQQKSPSDKILRKLFPYAKTTASTEEKKEQLNALTLNDIQNFYNRILNNSQANATFSVPENNFVNVQNEYISQLSQGLPNFRQFTPVLNQFQTYKPNMSKEILVDTEEKSQADISVSYQYKYTKNVDDTARILLLNEILGGGMSSRLFKDLRDKEKLAYHVSSNIDKFYDTGMMNLNISTSTDSSISAEASPENINKALQGFERNVNKLKTEHVSDDELKSAKNYMKSMLIDRMEGNLGKIDNSHSDISSFYGKEYTNKLLEAIDKINVEDIRLTANYVFANQPITSIVASQKTLDSLNLK